MTVLFAALAGVVVFLILFVADWLLMLGFNERSMDFAGNILLFIVWKSHAWGFVNLFVMLVVFSLLTWLLFRLEVH